MYCQKCGAALPETANFCHNCGAGCQRPENRQQQAAQESCEIVAIQGSEHWSPVFPTEDIRFVAQATGRQGGFIAGESASAKAGLGDYYGPNRKNRRHLKVWQELVDRLLNEGWQKDGRGEQWYSERFSRLEGTGNSCQK